jgi:hypothetical protein
MNAKKVRCGIGAIQKIAVRQVRVRQYNSAVQSNRGIFLI